MFLLLWQMPCTVSLRSLQMTGCEKWIHENASLVLCWVSWAVQKTRDSKLWTSGEGIHKGKTLSAVWKWQCDLSKYFAFGASEQKLAACLVFFQSPGTEEAKCCAACFCTKWHTCPLPLLPRLLPIQRLSPVDKNAFFWLLSWVPETVSLATVSQCQRGWHNLAVFFFLIF